MYELPEYSYSDVKDKTDKELLEQAIKKWQTIVEAAQEEHFIEEYGASTCACCAKYLDRHSCVGCPIYEDTGRSSCLGTPYENYNHRHSLENACAELEYLQNLYNRLYPPELEPEPEVFPVITEKYRNEIILENKNYKVYVHNTFVVVEGKTPNHPKEVFIYTSGDVDVNQRRVANRGELIQLIHLPEPSKPKFQQMTFTDFDEEQVTLVAKRGRADHDHLFVIKDGKILGYYHITGDGFADWCAHEPDDDEGITAEELLAEDDC